MKNTVQKINNLTIGFQSQKGEQISILKNDTPNILKKKLEKGIPSLIESLEKYLSNEIVGMELSLIHI